MSASKRNITHCKYGHEFTPENTRINKGGKRSCKICEFYNHLTGKVRGLLCRTCNLGIGHLQESPEVLLSAIEYLQKHKES